MPRRRPATLCVALAVLCGVVLSLRSVVGEPVECSKRVSDIVTPMRRCRDVIGVSGVVIHHFLVVLCVSVSLCLCFPYVRPLFYVLLLCLLEFRYSGWREG